MNLSNLYHALLAAAFQTVFGLAFLAFGYDPAVAFFGGGCIASGFYWGREVAQSERKQGGSPWWIGFDIRLWSIDSILDLLSPVTICAVIYAAILLYR